MTVDDEDRACYPRSWGRKPTMIRVKASTFMWMLAGDLIAFIFCIMIILGV